ncbi:hypothetical protein GCM10010266_12060 [Streptomyces griseomycini]|uniref:Uncharacterized protein n=1 Tax=Streptomyces griseomycini TaxID=66895 RepID=A0A7W7LW14_9ACTN|nr:hypothetical protein [Streptomyces griseomycini]GGP91006.1 hypothetical protein GCM10010266_12060 [Streptomyces griseomycini]GGR13502.1 hypothetical protein GCM10015536_19020 [Streptomyces griseomycini]
MASPGRPLHDTAQWPGGRSVGIGPVPEGGVRTRSSEGGSQENRGAVAGGSGLTRVDQRAFGPKATARPSTTTSAPVPPHAEGPVTRPGDRPLRVAREDYRRCCESATVTSTRWNSFSSL